MLTEAHIGPSTCMCTCAACAESHGGSQLLQGPLLRVNQGLPIPPAVLLLSAHMFTPMVIPARTVTPSLTVTTVHRMFSSQRCSGALGHINGLAEDGEWHCHLPYGHDGVCLALDGTTW